MSQNTNLWHPFLCVYEMPRGIRIRVLERNRNAYFLRNSRGALVIIYVFAMFYYLRKYVRVDKTLIVVPSVSKRANLRS